MWMLYGAYGYTGALTARLAVERGLSPVLAGRSEAKLAPLAKELGLEFRVLGLDDPEALRAGIQDCDLVLHHAGPYAQTSKPMVDACLATGTHYLDITGEIGVFERVLSRDAEAREAGVVLMPGVGFDVVPTDCACAKVAQALPDATHLELAFATLGGQISRGTTLTTLQGLGMPSAERVEGRIVPVPLGHRTRWIDFPAKRMHVASIPWGDIATAYRTTGIPNIITYMGMKPSAMGQIRMANRLGFLLKTAPVQALLAAYVRRTVTGPDDAARADSGSWVYAEARNAGGDVATVFLSTPNGYSLTADASLVIAQRVLAGEVDAGATTPAKGLGADLVDGLEGVEVQEVQVVRAGD